ncbi:hypothetical protein VIN01S_25760 [Vibrio inusitatus NBRC 102082]|uniref:START domain-containing protein n=1 Tax=Vibrio inusitatus NBRC 102082 TaxID=1219070 RepID=A0A4Y3HYM2_9VIBR|nr:hypothetical protein [Vibrio inusitatus]GEA51772.1 hypothetical protein VIN01S_25760 [Vibrio inusitatus NBRC 102082]
MKLLLLGAISILAIPFMAMSDESDVLYVEESMFESNARPSGGEVWLDTSKSGERNETLYTARFLSKMTSVCISQLDFSSPQILDRINRKTSFSLVDDQLRGKRPAGLLSITFDIEVKELNLLTHIPASYSVEQHLYNYNMFVDEAQFSFVMKPISEDEVVVDVEASNRVASTIPTWVNNMFQSNVEGKILHFQSALTELCSK